MITYATYSNNGSGQLIGGWSIENEWEEMEIDDSTCESIADEIRCINAMSAESLEREYDTTCKAEAIESCVDAYQMANALPYNTFIEELIYRGVIKSDPRMWRKKTA